MTSRCRRPGRLAVLVAASVIGLAACGGSSSTPQVASLGNGSSHGTGGGSKGSPAPQSGNPTQLLDEWATCIRGYGDPNQTDPTIDSNKDIQITMTNVSQTLSSEVHGGTGPCSNYLQAASLSLSNGQGTPTDNPTQDLKYAECMRANGVPNFPDPNGSGTTNLLDIDTNSAIFQNADKVCTEKVGEKYYPPGSEAPGVIVVTSCVGLPPGKPCHPPNGPGAGGGNGGSGGNG